MKFDEYQRYDAIGLAELVHRREVTPAELLTAAQSRLEAVNSAINAVIRRLDGEAERMIAEAAPDAPLRGVPFLLKDITARMQGVPTAAGSRLFQDQPCEADSAIVAAYRRAGLVIFGKTNTPEFGLACTTEPALYGPTRNPWNLERIAGGSSGGSAAAVAAGIVPAAHASDGGGSIRIPASCCGVFGLKPSRGRVSMAPGGEGWGSLSVQHVVSRSVRDSAILLDIACQPVVGDPYYLAPPAESFAAQAARAPSRLRIGVTKQALMYGTMHADCAGAVDETAALCAELGHEVEEIAVSEDFIAMAQAVNVLVSSSVAEMIDAELERRGEALRQGELETLSRSMWDEGKTTHGTQYVAALKMVHAFGRRFARLFEGMDVMLLSTLAHPPPALGYMNTNAPDLTGYAERLYGFMPNTQPFNVSGLPAASVPLGWSADGLPIGVQIGAGHGREGLLLQLAAQLEAARPWGQRRPALQAQRVVA
jgi:amidase